MPEDLVIRPPSEASSLLVRVMRGCSWNRCLFCGIYDMYGVPFSTRDIADIKKDIDALYEIHGDRFRTAFLGDADPMALPADLLAEAIDYLRKKFPSIKRVTTYGRASSIWKKTPEEMGLLSRSGLDRIHTGMESGSNQVLRMQKKGTTAGQLMDAGKKVMDAGIELSYYVLLGLGGQEYWRDHVSGSVRVLNEVRPGFIRVRRLWIHPLSRLIPEIEKGAFVPQTPEGTVIELKTFIEGLDAPGSTFACDHANNYIQVYGRLNHQKKKMLDTINAFLSLGMDERQRHYENTPSLI